MLSSGFCVRVIGPLGVFEPYSPLPKCQLYLHYDRIRDGSLVGLDDGMGYPGRYRTYLLSVPRQVVSSIMSNPIILASSHFLSISTVQI
jgi:hypothetical protein